MSSHHHSSKQNSHHPRDKHPDVSHKYSSHSHSTPHSHSHSRARHHEYRSHHHRDDGPHLDEYRRKERSTQRYGTPKIQHLPRDKTEREEFKMICPICNQNDFRTTSKLFLHVCAKHPDDFSRVRCNLCESSRREVEGFGAHLLSEHIDDVDEISRKQPIQDVVSRRSESHLMWINMGLGSGRYRQDIEHRGDEFSMIASLLAPRNRSGETLWDYLSTMDNDGQSRVKGRCGICKKGLEDDEDGIGICAVSILKCNHVFHSGCIDDDTGCEMRCPTCGCGGLGESEGCGVGLKRRRKEVGQLKAAKKRKEEDFGES
eukprot:TRINITY_DN2477_c0_g1_i2.p1 TRINITY_DN2477_c0_g1~~TRINITY_DN2477_c0_g1_i2.p1  ORF type:complete len:316 (-),score=24.34 TRINITY_DN2477_c0_g1_i2:19-966(-)